MISGSDDANRILTAQEKRSVLAGNISLYCTGFALLHFFLDFSQGMYSSAAFDACIASAIFFCYILNRIKYYRTAKILGLSVLNTALVIYGSVVPEQVGIYLYYFPMITISSALFGQREKKIRYIFIVLPFFMLLILFVTDFTVLDEYSLESLPDVRLFFVINAISSVIIMIMCINFILNLNEASEYQLQRMAEEIKAKNNDLEKTNSELDRFLYSTSHDLRSPLSSIKGLINVARFDTTDSKMHSYFKMMIDRVERLEHFIKDIIDYSKNARTDLRDEPVDFALLLSEVTDNLKYAEGAATIEFKKRIEVDHPVTMDKGRLGVILSNLMANAIKYHDLRKEHQWIDVSVTNSGPCIKLCVSDNGTGIAEEHQQRIFDMFYRGTLQSTGSGLGLYIVKQTVEKMEGTISVESAPGAGSAFHVTLPVS